MCTLCAVGNAPVPTSHDYAQKLFGHYCKHLYTCTQVDELIGAGAVLKHALALTTIKPSARPTARPTAKERKMTTTQERRRMGLRPTNREYNNPNIQTNLVYVL